MQRYLASAMIFVVMLWSLPLKAERVFAGREYLEVADDYHVELFIACKIEKILDFWPVIRCPGAVNTNLPDDYKLIVGSSVVKEEFTGSSTANYVKNAARNKIFDQLYRDQFIVVNDKKIYHEIQNLVSNRRQKLSEKLVGEVNHERGIITLTGVAVAAGLMALFVIWMALWSMYISTINTVRAYLPVIKSRVDEVRDNARDKKSRKIVEKAVLEEAARISTRAAMTVFDEREIGVIQKQINEALGKGDYETAQSLMSTLRKIEGK